jgi:hypothetical protein
MVGYSVFDSALNSGRMQATLMQTVPPGKPENVQAPAVLDAQRPMQDDAP